jgi:cytochrome P450
MAKAREEINSVIGTGEVWGKYEQYKRLNYLENVMYEAMRLYAPVPVLTRETKNDVRLGKYDVPKGTTIMLSVWAMHRSPAIWGDDVDCFRPERFDRGDARENKRHPFSYMPFSLGPRDCIGRNLAIIEAKVVLSSILQRFDMSVAPGQPDEVPTDSYIIPVRPAGGLYMNIKPLQK